MSIWFQLGSYPFLVNVFILYPSKHQKTKVNNKDTRTTPMFWRLQGV